jgi:hypothetical protein
MSEVDSLFKQYTEAWGHAASAKCFSTIGRGKFAEWVTQFGGPEAENIKKSLELLATSSAHESEEYAKKFATIKNATFTQFSWTVPK